MEDESIFMWRVTANSSKKFQSTIPVSHCLFTGGTPTATRVASRWPKSLSFPPVKEFLRSAFGYAVSYSKGVGFDSQSEGQQTCDVFVFFLTCYRKMKQSTLRWVTTDCRLVFVSWSFIHVIFSRL